jgi:hypothetical protein
MWFGHHARERVSREERPEPVTGGRQLAFS